MLINFSNHPIEKWSIEQRETALMLYGEIVDLQFPQINPAATLEEVKNVVADFAARVITLFKNRKTDTSNVIHLMGEYTFTYQFAKEMEKLQMQCVASTTERIVSENPDGSKTTVFMFVKFRPYF